MGDSRGLHGRTGKIYQLSTLIHELGHWYQYQKIKQNHPEFRHEEILAKEIENSKGMVEKMVEDGYNIRRGVSRYALNGATGEKEF